MKEPKQCEQTLDFSQTLPSPILSVAGSFVAGLETSHPSHQPLPVCACRKLAGFADKSTSVAPTQTQTLYFGTDILGSVRNVTDKYGAVQANYNYDAFGNPYLSNLDNDMNFGYCGKIYDNGTGLYDYGFRDYSPNNARFTTIDPIRDGNNWFAYVVNDPVNYIDPFGLESTDNSITIEKGDTLSDRTWQYNKQHGTNHTWQEIAEYNGLENPHLIFPGDVITFPTTPTPPAPAQPTPSAPTPAAPAPTAPAPTVPTPSVPSAPPVSTGNLSSPSGGHSSGNFNNSNSYIQRSVEQIILGNYTDEVTLLGTAIQILLSFLNFDVLADIRDLSADFVNWEWSKQHVLCTSLDLVALLPVLGILKNTDEAAALVKNGKKASAAGNVAKIGHTTPWAEMSVAQRKAFQHSYSRHASEFGLPNWSQSKAAELQSAFNQAVGNVRSNATNITTGYKLFNGQSVQVRIYESTINNKPYYYYETMDGQFISAGINTR